MCCCCFNLHRHIVHLISYGSVAFLLISTGLVFTVFAIFYKDTQIGKVWLAGPTTMVVGLVLCGKVIIDWQPAMLHAREGSIDSALVDQMANPVMNVNHDGSIPYGYSIINNDGNFARPANGHAGHCPRHSRAQILDEAQKLEEQVDIVYPSYGSSSNSNRSSACFYRVSQPFPGHPVTAYNRPEHDQSPQSPLAPLRVKLGMTPQTTSQGAPVIAPRLVPSVHSGNYQGSFSSSSPPPPPPPIQNVHPVAENFSQANHVPVAMDASSSLLRSFATHPSSHFPVNDAAECQCFNAETSYQGQFRPQPPPTYDYGSLQREFHTAASRSLYQGETFVLNEKSYFI